MFGRTGTSCEYKLAAGPPLALTVSIRYLIMEYVEGGELFNYVDDLKGLTEPESSHILRQIVSALLYCHRLLICHRDLKPENILLDRKTLTVKLIDFGMAALQPEGRLLSTPCGSPHYAAPEVVSNQPYDGTQADVWSCGVILYVMLTGTTPYNYSNNNDMRELFRDIARAHYFMPTSLSRQAQDLIRRIFVPNPRKRITMDEVWDHAFIHKYSEQYGYVGEKATKQWAVGVAPQINQWKIKRIQDIDREILRNMRTLWHSEAEQCLIEKLLNDEHNQEKLFYAALVKHREEHLENYCGDVDDIGYSASDYHHSRPPPLQGAPPLPSDRAQRSQSQYSIMNDEHLRPSQSFVGPPPSMSSYDPYRSSKDPLVSSPGDYLNITVHRNGTTSTGRASKGGRNLRHPNSTRIETLKQVSRRASTQSSSSLQRSGRSKPSMIRSSMSKHSLASAGMASSPPVVTRRPSDVHKRGVSFGHMRRVSTASALTSQGSTRASAPETPCMPGNPREHHMRACARMNETAESSPTVHAEHPLKSRKERNKGAVGETPRIKVRKPQTPGHYMRNDIRMHSAELEKACEEAFQIRESFGSTMTTHTQASASDRPAPYDTPPSSVSAVSPELPLKTASRPLPELPKDTPNTYLTRTLEETRSKLAAYKGSGDENAAKFDEVMKMLDNIMPGTSPSTEKRIMSAPEASKIAEQYGFLPIISEEGSDPRSSKDDGNWHRSVTAPVTKERRPADRTIRVVPQSSPAVAPLNVYKRNTGSPASEHSPCQRLSATQQSSATNGTKRVNEPSPLMVIEEDSALLTTPTIVRKKRSGWFGRNKKDGHIEMDTEITLASSALTGHESKGDHRQSQTLIHESAVTGVSSLEPPASALSSEFPMRKPRFGAGKNGFSKWIGRIGRDKGVDTTTTEAGKLSKNLASNLITNLTVSADVTTNTIPSMDSNFSSASPTPSSNDAPPTSEGPERSWFARFFKMKPAVHILCFNISRGRARQELVILLKEWKRHGIRDLQYSRENNTITARVDKINSLEIKPVTFRIELFVVLEHGCKVDLSIARFVQVKGAVSGFRRVLDVIDGVMKGRSWLVEDEDKWRALCEVVGS